TLPYPTIKRVQDKVQRRRRMRVTPEYRGEDAKKDRTERTPTYLVNETEHEQPYANSSEEKRHSVYQLNITLSCTVNSINTLKIFGELLNLVI
ncbi:hypothetical protein L9F63_002576, partial [Diploptera punctata]